MFKNKEIEKLKGEIELLKNKVNELEWRTYAIGEVYTNVPDASCSHLGVFYFLSPYYRWLKFSNTDDAIDQKVKINGVWYDRSQVIFYDEDIKKKKQIIEKMVKGKGEKK